MAPSGVDLAALARSSGALAMLALDQRESLRAMLRSAAVGWSRAPAIPDRALVDFKVEASAVLSDVGSAVLLDVDLGLWRALRAGAIAPGIGLIAAADRLTMGPTGMVASTELDEAVLTDDAVAERVHAYKLLVIWRLDADPGPTLDLVGRFVERVRARGRIALVEPVVRAPAGVVLDPASHVAAVADAAARIGPLGPDVYKAEVPTLGAGSDVAITAGARVLTGLLPCPWVVLSNGTPAARFPDAAVAAARGGASGFLAGRGIWAASLPAADRRAHLQTVARPAFARLVERIDATARPWWSAVTAG
jgi:sulfofructosephosphate aldolase